MHARGWQPFAFQQEAWDAIGAGRSGLLHATTGSGKTYAVWLGIVQALLTAEGQAPASRSAPPLRVLWITPMRALAADTTRALGEPLQDMAPHWTLGLRTGAYTSPHLRRYAERVRIDGSEADDAALCAAFTRAPSVAAWRFTPR
ncbi:MAG: DEAD/DEAH box helicase, partial [Burkholderiaceae bacterium]